MNTKAMRTVAAVLGCSLILALASCATQPESYASSPPGFFSGLLHGFIMPFSLIGDIFLDISIYAYPNTGGFYDFGFFLGACMLLGGSGAGAARAS